MSKSKQPTQTLRQQLTSSLNGLKSINAYNLPELSALQFNHNNLKWDADEFIRKSTALATVNTLLLQLAECEEIDIESFIFTNARKMISSIRSLTSNSTSMYSNAINESQREACIEILDVLMGYLEPATH